jgi:phosphoglucosamine mutase
MTRKYFGTDGVRGRVGEFPLTVEFVLRLASAAARVLGPNGGSVLVGKDTRLSGYLFESALEAGFVAAGLDVLLTGPLPTPGIAFLTQKLNCAFGVVISASHNAYQDNGIKFFDRTGGKLSDALEAEIERHLDEPATTVASEQLGSARRIDRSRTLYQDFCKASLPAGTDLSDLRVVIDCANGAGYKVAPRVLAELGIDATPIGCAPNGRNINKGCGSTEPNLLCLTVKGISADCGIALDGDGDRLVMVDHEGRQVDGDQLLYVLAKGRLAQNRLEGPVIGTVMSNLGLEHALKKLGVEFKRAAVGDRHVLSMMRQTGAVLGGETSGHILCLDCTTTGDGTVSALQVLYSLKVLNMTLAEAVADMPKYPQAMVNVRLDRKVSHLLKSPAVQKVKQVSEERMGSRGRVVLRASGTEPLIRVMVEHEIEDEAHTEAEFIAQTVREAANEAA